VPIADPGAQPDPTAEGPVLRLDWQSAAWIAGGLIVAQVLVAFFRNVPDSLTRVGVGVLLAFALDPLVSRLRARYHCSRATAVAIVGATVALLFAVLVLVLGPPAIKQARRFGRELPRTVEELYDIPLAGSWLEDLDVASRAREWAADLPTRIDTEAITNTAKGLVDGVVAGLVVVAVGLAVLVDGERLVRRLLAAIPDRIEAPAVRVGRIFYRTVGAYFSGSLLVATLSATFILALGLAFGVPLAPAAALWMLVVNLIPQIGGLLGGGFFVILALSKGVFTGLICLVLYLVYQQLENHVIQPAVVGKAVDLSAPATMLAALVGGAAAGIPGALVATPVVGAAKALYLELRWGVEPEEQRPRLPLPSFLRRRRSPR
jgi:putative heme transporter